MLPTKLITLASILFLILGKSSIASENYKIRYQCPSPELKAQTESMVSKIIQESLLAFESSVPLIAEKMKKQLEHKRLIIDCESDEEMKKDIKNVSAVTTKIEYQPDVINLGISENQNQESLISKYRVLHELLHFVKIDNFSSRKHNQIFDSESREADTVYSCAFIVYPAEDLKMNFEKALNTCKTVN